MSTNTPDTAERRGVLSGRSAASESSGASRLKGLTLTLPSDPGRQARNASFRGSAELSGLPLSAVGLDDPPGTDGEPKGAMPVGFRGIRQRSSTARRILRLRRRKKEN
ncbi:hypothetical protein WB66_22990 [bacteria symbiont BFo1 of Frankliniella occidentalis]|nr:hypothetical protein AI28_10435 [bacteria symbiont BFo1 of Frankliniella occidentalis]KYP82486.1 hypothetical protein WB66_22990 [bacteria symbiont BFo1 of Frankliniella occidentalis]